MEKHLLSITAMLALSLGACAVRDTARVQAAPNHTTYEFASPTIASDAVGGWLYDPQGNTIGSVRSVEDGGRTAVIMMGSYFRPGSYEARVPAHALYSANGKVMLQNEVIQALNVRLHTQG